jgi:hypothetical protein
VFLACTGAEFDWVKLAFSGIEQKKVQRDIDQEGLWGPIVLLSNLGVSSPFLVTSLSFFGLLVI